MVAIGGDESCCSHRRQFIKGILKNTNVLTFLSEYMVFILVYLRHPSPWGRHWGWGRNPADGERTGMWLTCEPTVSDRAEVWSAACPDAGPWTS